MAITRAWVGHDFINQRINQLPGDAIQFVHDQVTYNINRGIKRDELAGKSNIVRESRQRPMAGEYYGTVAHSVRNIYNGYLGWWMVMQRKLARPGVQRNGSRLH